MLPSVKGYCTYFRYCLCEYRAGTRRGGLDKEGVEAVGGVVIARYGSNPLEVINNCERKDT